METSDYSNVVRSETKTKSSRLRMVVLDIEIKKDVRDNVDYLTTSVMNWPNHKVIKFSFFVR